MKAIKARKKSVGQLTPDELKNLVRVAVTEVSSTNRIEFIKRVARMLAEAGLSLYNLLMVNGNSNPTLFEISPNDIGQIARYLRINGRIQELEDFLGYLGEFCNFQRIAADMGVEI